jgi:hypothetical protein
MITIWPPVKQLWENSLIYNFLYKKLLDDDCINQNDIGVERIGVNEENEGYFHFI